jgi:uncharacterized membrane protein
MQVFGVFYGHLVFQDQLAYLKAFWYILWSVLHIVSIFGFLYQEKSGNPAHHHHGEMLRVFKAHSLACFWR